MEENRPRTARTPLKSALALAVLAASCQGYRPRPLDLDAHRRDWHARTLEDGSLDAFLARLGRAEPGSVEALDLADGLGLAEGRLVALAFNPDLRLARLRLARAAAGAEHAGAWSDPTLELDVLRITEDVPDRWIVSPGLAFTVPLSGRLGAERDLARAEVDVARRRVLEAEWSVRLELERAWIAWSAARLRAEETQRLAAELETLVTATGSLAEAGELARTEAALFALEHAQRRVSLERLRGETAEAEQRVRALLGLAPEAPVELVPTLALAVDEDARAAREDELVARNPELARLRDEYRVAEETLRREVARQVPDLTLGPLYESDEGQSRIGFLAGIPLPFLNANRRAIAEARAERELARAMLEAACERLVGRRAALVARLDGLAAQRAETEATLLPLAERQLADASRLVALGEVGTLILLESLTRAHHARLELVELRAAESLARAELEHLVGPPASAPAPDRKTQDEDGQ